MSDLERARDLLRSPDEPTRLRGVHLLRDGAEPRDGAADLLVMTLTDTGSYVPHAARAALQTMGHGAHPALRRGLTDPEVVVRRDCTWALAAPQGQRTAEVVDLLAGPAADPDPSVREAAAAALARVGGDPIPRADLLDRLLTDSAERVRGAAAASCGTDPVVGALLSERLLDLLDEPSAGVRREVAAALAELPSRDPALPRVRQALHEEVSAAVRDRLAVLLERWEAGS